MTQYNKTSRNNYLSYLIFLGLVFSFLISIIKTHPGSPNDLSRLAGIIAIARFDELNIDRTTQITTIDKALASNKFYSSKPPVLNWVLGNTIKWGFLAAKPVLLLNDVAIYKAATFLATTLPLILIIILFLLVFFKILQNPIKLILVTSPLLFSTLFLGYSQYLNNHVPTSFFTFVIFSVIFVFKLKPLTTDALLGISLSAILALDPPFALLITLSLLPFLLYKYSITDQRSHMIIGKLSRSLIVRFARIALFALPISLLHFYLTYKIFGILTIPQLYKDIFFSYEGSHWINKPSNDINVYNPGFLIVTFNYLFLSHGFFLYTPIFLLFFFYRNKKEAGWLFSLLLLVISVAAYSIYSTNYGGWSYGARRLVPLIPIFYYYTAKTLSSLKKQVLLFIVLPLFLISTFFAYLGFENTWNNKRIKINRKIAYFPLLYNLNRKYFHTFDYDP